MTKAPAGLVFPDVQEPDLFGDAYPSGYDPNAPTRPAGFASRATKEDRDGLFGDNPELTGSATKGKAAKVNRSAMIGRACDLLKAGNGPAECAGGLFYKTEHHVTTFSGMVVRKDLLGFMDAAGITPSGRAVAIQVTTPEAVNKHLSDYTNPLKTTGTGKVPVEVGLRRFLDCNGLFLIASYRKEGRLWVFDFRTITHHDLDAAISRKRKK